MKLEIQDRFICSIRSITGTVDTKCERNRDYSKIGKARLTFNDKSPCSSEPNRMESRAVNASSNYWGRLGDSNDIGARIYDKFDNKSLIEVNFYPPYLESTRLRQGKCDPGWTLDDTMCYIYLGAVTTYRIAQEMCSSIDARIARRDVPLNRLVILRALARTSQYQGINSDAVPPSGIWLRKDYSQDCRIFNDMQTMDVSCSSTAGFICEKGNFYIAIFFS